MCKHWLEISWFKILLTSLFCGRVERLFLGLKNAISISAKFSKIIFYWLLNKICSIINLKKCKYCKFIFSYAIYFLIKWVNLSNLPLSLNPKWHFYIKIFDHLWENTICNSIFKFQRSAVSASLCLSEVQRIFGKSRKF